MSGNRNNGSRRGGMSLASKITLIMLSALILSTSIIGVFAYVMQRDSIIEESAKRALAIAQTVGAALDTDQYAQIMESGEMNDYYEDYKSFLDETYIKSGAAYLYIVDKYTETETVYFAEGYAEGISVEDPYYIGDTEAIDVYPQEMQGVFNNGRDTVTDVYDLGGYGSMVTGFSPIKDGAGRVQGVVGVDISIEDMLEVSNRFGLLMVLIVAAMCSIVAIIIVRYMRVSVGRPLEQLTKAADRLAVGDLDVTVDQGRRDEIGMLATSFAHMIEGTHEQAHILERLAEGDLTIEVVPRCDRDAMGNALAETVGRLNAMFAGILTGSEEVSTGSRYLANGAQAVAQGSTEQSAAIEDLSMGITKLSGKASENVRMAERAAKMFESVRKNAHEGSERMERMLTAVGEINDASRSIEKVIKVIEDIAFQTNILALNASVEAARAGTQGKGFAVVAEEVRNLAGKSSEAAKNTNSLISNSIEKASLGAKIAEETSASLREIIDGVVKGAEVISDIAALSGEQAESTGAINHSVAQVSKVVQSNSSTAQQSAAASQQVSGHADMLKEMAGRFRLKA